MNEAFAIHYKGQLIDGRVYHEYNATRKGRLYTSIAPAKAFITRKLKWLKTQGREKEILDYEVVRYVPEIVK